MSAVPQAWTVITAPSGKVTGPSVGSGVPLGGSVPDPADFESELRAAGFERIEIEETHRVHEHAASALIRAHAPA